MAWECGYFNSVNGDRKYNADSFNNFLEGLVTYGIFASVGNKLAVQPSSGMTIQVASGKGWFANHWVKNTSPLQLTLEQSDVTLNRYAAICIRVDETISARKAEIYVKYSDIAISPKKPTMIRNEYVNEYCLAYVYIAAGVSSISASAITDTRSDNNLCGWVTGLIEQIDIDTIYTQFTELSQEWLSSTKENFQEWLGDIQDAINNDTEKMLVAALPTSIEVTIEPESWLLNENVYSTDITITGMTATKTVFVIPKESSSKMFLSAHIQAKSQGVGKLTLQAEKLPNEQISALVCYMGK